MPIAESSQQDQDQVNGGPMKITGLLIFSALFSSSAFAICPNHSTTLGRFFTRLTAERDFVGRRAEITTIGDGMPIFEPLRGEHTITRRSNTLTITGASCGPLPNDMCQELEAEVWRYNPLNRCLYVDGNEATIVRSTSSALEYQYGKGSNLVRGNYRFNIAGQFVINRIIQTPSRLKLIWFSGR